MFKNILPWWSDNKRIFDQSVGEEGQQGHRPSGELLPYQALHRDINQAFTNFWRTFDQVQSFGGEKWGALASLDVKETEKELVISMDLPGFTEDNIHVSLVNQLLTVKAERKQEQDNKEKDYFLQERQYGKIQRSVALPENIDSDSVKAEYKNGVLKITIPKTQTVTPEAKKIPISR